MDEGVSGDNLLGWLVAYPRSLAAALFTPRRLLTPTAQSQYCPPAVALAISLLLCWLGDGLVHRVEFGVPGNIDYPSLGATLGTVAWILLVIVAIRAVFARVFRLPGESSAAALRLLTWPASVGLSAFGVLTLLAALFPSATVTLAGYVDRGITRLADTWAFPMIWTHAVHVAPVLPAIALFAWALFNIARIGFGASRVRAALATAVGVVVALLVSGGVAEFSGRITRQLYLWTNTS